MLTLVVIKKVARILNNKEPIKDGAPIIYQDRKEGVRPDHNIRTDRFEIATEAMDKVNKNKIAKREQRHKDFVDKLEKDNKDLNKGKDGGTSPDTTTGGETTPAT